MSPIPALFKNFSREKDHDTVESQKRIIESVAEISKANVGLRAYERQLETAGSEWLDHLDNKLKAAKDESEEADIIVELSAVLESLWSATGTVPVNRLVGRTLGMLVEAESSSPRSRRIMKRLLSKETAGYADNDRKRLLVINPATGATRMALFEGIEKVQESESHLSPDVTDCVDTRVKAVADWLGTIGVKLSSLDGIACRCGFINPVPSGTYRLAPEMLGDLEHPRIEHASNMAVAITMQLAEMSGRADELLLTTSDPVVSDEMDLVDRLTGYIKIKRDGTGSHYLNHKAVLRVLASLLGRKREDVNAITAHLGNGMSVSLHRRGRVTSLVDAFSGIPTPSRCGPLDLPRLIDAMRNDEMTLKDLEAVTFSRGGLLSLAGTNDFRTLEGFRFHGANPVQQKKIDLIFDFFARQISMGALKLTADGLPVDFLALTGGIARSKELVRRIDNDIAGRYPLVLIPGSLEDESLAAGLIRGFYEPETLKNYVDERDTLQHLRHEEDRLIDTTIFERKILYRKKDAPIYSLDELIDATCLTVKEKMMPAIAIVGADNEDAILAAKRANEEGSYRIAKFHLVGDFAAINQVAYDYDLVIDNDNYIIHDTDEPVETATRLLEEGRAHVIMKGSMKTEKILRGVFQYLKRSGRLKPGELMSHVFVMDIPVRNKLLLISDAAVNTYPNDEKRIKIVENALRVAEHLNIRKPKVAIISAIESVNQSIGSSVDAERIAGHFASRDDCIVEGPLSFDVAMDAKIAAEKNYKGQIRGTADILIMPDIDAGNVLYKSLTTQSGATSAGVIMCGDMPMVLTSRGDSARSKLASISLAVKIYLDLH